MKLVSFSVQNYRSITKAHKIKIRRSVVLIGPNNEGKSNVIRGLVTAMRLIRHGTRMLSAGGNVQSMLLRSASGAYEWENDFPISLQESHLDGQSVFVLEFELNKTEINEFFNEVGSHVNEKLPIRIAVGRHGATLTVSKRGRWIKALSRKAGRIAQFVVKRVQFEYIEAVRTAESAERVVNSLVENQLATLESSTEYQEAIALIDKVQKPLLDSLSKSIRDTLVRFLPAIVDVTFEVTSERRFSALRRSAKMIIDDGTPTSLEYKGDGVQSLSALALMRHSSESAEGTKNFLIAVEEPESHLHPQAMHGLKSVLQELAEKHQVVITTHSPVFVDRAHLESNVIVQDGKAQVAKDIKQIREILGVRASDNLQHAELVLIVEGDDDTLALRALLLSASSRLATAITNGRLALDAMGGSGNLSYKISQLKQALCQCHCFLDRDEASNRSFERAEEEGLLSVADANFAHCPGCQESELEDLYDVDLYKQMFLGTYRVSLDDPKFKGREKWSDRIKRTFESQGKAWNKRIKMDAKRGVADLVVSNPSRALNPHTKAAFEALVSVLENRLAGTHSA